MRDKHSFERIEINKLASTIILGTSFSTIFLFGLIFYMYFDPKSGYTSALKESLSITASFFGGITTLVAAYIATRLFNRWQDQHNKQVNSDFIMKFYDNLFDMKSEAISVVGFLIDYANLNFDRKIKHYDDLLKHNSRLCHLNDFSMQKISDLAFILDEEDYNKTFKNRINELGEKLRALLNIYSTFIKTYSPTQRVNLIDQNKIRNSEQILLKSLPHLQSDLYDHYRAFMVELEKYYKA